MTDEPTNEEEQEGVKVAVLAQGDTASLKELAAVLTAAHVPHDIVPPPGCDERSCGPTLMLVTPMEELQPARAAIEAHWNQDLGEAELAAVGTVVDLDAEQATCPACATPFPTGDATRCPECGLNFGAG